MGSKEVEVPEEGGEKKFEGSVGSVARARDLWQAGEGLEGGKVINVKEAVICCKISGNECVRRERML